MFTENPKHPFDSRRELVFMILAGIFWGTLSLSNILGLTRFIDLSFTLGGTTVPMLIPLGVLPYPLTFLCTDLISEFYGKQRANRVVWIGLLINLWIFFLLWLGGVLPPSLDIEASTQLPLTSHPDYAFFKIRALTMGGILGSMLAYLAAQFIDIHLFHFWKDLTKNKHLWLRNNGSTLISQFVDTVLVTIIVYFFTQALPPFSEGTVLTQLLMLIGSSYTFKCIAALLDTLPFYYGVFYLRRYFGANPQGNANTAPVL